MMCGAEMFPGAARSVRGLCLGTSGFVLWPLFGQHTVPEERRATEPSVRPGPVRGTGGAAAISAQQGRTRAYVTGAVIGSRRTEGRG